jgi:hypothetical protein
MFYRFKLFSLKYRWTSTICMPYNFVYFVVAYSFIIITYVALDLIMDMFVVYRYN